MERHERMSMFFLPREESASAARSEEPKRQPMKKEDWGRPVMKVLAHSRPKWEIIVFEGCESQDQEDFGRVHMLEDEVHDDVLVFVQCHVG